MYFILCSQRYNVCLLLKTIGTLIWLILLRMHDHILVNYAWMPFWLTNNITN